MQKCLRKQRDQLREEGWGVLEIDSYGFEGTEDAKLKWWARGGGSFFPAPLHHLSSLLFPTATAGKFVQGIRDVYLQLILPIFQLSCKVCPKEWEELMNAEAESAEVGGVLYFRHSLPISYGPR